MRSQLRHLAFVVSVLSVLVALPVKAPVNQDSVETEVAQDSQKTSLETLPGISHLGELEQPAITLEEWVAQIAQARLQVTGVQLNPTPEGLEVVLITTGERLPQSFQTSIGETLVIDLINTQLPDGVTTLSEVR